ncbi:hypothetical protein E1295_00035 [Nonomuraea mesophila]|uniref:Uncharacterized protein n=1 Tax=Nonomuraea mesophila TaxID=2530382 RepID=A0A4R5FXI9_9ACTN|nr:DUF6262 family protein [Nonomuraea mesophila]TDE60277.1 hypothetical protein E1295_00035 [Nonomuraea mesophila]
MTDQPDDLPSTVRDACADLIRAGEHVTFTAIAARIGLSRTTLYRRRDLRQIIEQHRDSDGETLTLTGVATQIDQLRQALEAIAANVRRHEEHLRTLRRTERAR